MSDKIYLRRGNIADIPTLAAGEPGFALDTKKLYIGTTASGNQGIVSSAPTLATWIAPTLKNAWVNSGGGTDSAGYYKDDLGIVHVKGNIKSGTTTTSTAMLTLPAGYRTLAILTKATISNDVFGYFQIDSVGNFLFISGSNLSFSIECSFRAEQ